MATARQLIIAVRERATKAMLGPDFRGDQPFRVDGDGAIMMGGTIGTLLTGAQLGGSGQDSPEYAIGHIKGMFRMLELVEDEFTNIEGDD